MSSKILLLDIETAPHLAYVWGTFKQNIAPKQIAEYTQIISFAAKWLGKGDVYVSVAKDDKEEKVLLLQLRELLHEADIVVTHNGQKFDTPVVFGRMLVHRIGPPSPFHQVDTYAVARKEFRFASNSLENIAIQLGVRQKSGHKEFPGFELWLECMKGNKKAWAELVEYNVQDVEVLEDVYNVMRPYMRGHPHVNASVEGCNCPKCGSDDINYRGYYTTRAGLVYRRFVCKDCGGWGRDRFKEKGVPNNSGRNAR